ncbi:hypothetical protein K227x_47000 [Rubripirellula lacrimiformis]|uniref:Methyltransferase domain-containing protein n=1 Tax=Rubripirellula lacrimiformis TaxID=1930273 RepID=A0A517NGN5_9BACT|nr:class I SAM-dependent methyltransferase [Rubripirellula lacrimiformis]QDT06291.1 hypothetical protein K227x_47000 [Rubripirellula lacrimiformis]
MIKQTIKSALGIGKKPESVGQQQPGFYDDMYASSEEYRKPFWQSRYYFLWTVLVERLRTGGASQVLEIGCGSGQFAELLYRDLNLGYLGVDISQEGIRQATQKGLANYRFETADAIQSPILTDASYDTVVCTEVLEHIEQDLEMIQRIKAGTRCLCTIPNFPYVSHVRHFASCREVTERYGGLFDDFSVWGLAGTHREGVVYYLFDGVRRDQLVE